MRRQTAGKQFLLTAGISLIAAQGLSAPLQAVCICQAEQLAHCEGLAVAAAQQPWGIELVLGKEPCIAEAAGTHTFRS